MNVLEFHITAGTFSILPVNDQFESIFWDNRMELPFYQICPLKVHRYVQLKIQNEISQ